MEAMPPVAMGGMTADHMGNMPPDCMGGMDADMIGACPPEAMAGAYGDMMAAMPPEAIAGMYKSMLTQIPVEAVAEVDWANVPPEAMDAGITAFQEAIANGSSPAEAFEIGGQAADPMPPDMGDMTADMMGQMPPEAMSMNADMMGKCLLKLWRHDCTNDGSYASSCYGWYDC